MSKQPTAKFEDITPIIAAQILKDKNTHNRNVSERSLNHYVRQIQEGQWMTNGDAIRIATDGTLLDGQHRLMAIVKTKKALKTLVVRGLSKDVMPTIDTGRGRTVADHLKLQHKYNVGSYTATAAAILLISKFKKGVYTDSHERLTPAEAIAFIEQNPGILKSAELINNKTLVGLTTPSVAIATHYMFSKIDKFKAEEFFDRLTTGESLGKYSPILKLRVQFLEMRSPTKRTGTVNKRIFLYYMVTAFEAFIRGRRIDNFDRLTAESVIELPKRGG